MEDQRDIVDGYYINQCVNFIQGGSYSQIDIKDWKDKSKPNFSYAEAMDMAASMAKERGAYAFFYQMHHNGHEIVGFY